MIKNRYDTPCFSEKGSAGDRIRQPGYVYVPLMNNIYGRTPRNLGMPSK
jgi:hypothetical protein